MNIAIGRIINEPAPPKDAVHVAVAQVLATRPLLPGTHIGVIDGKCSVGPPIGIVDPFLQESVRTGEYFWLFLYPNTVEGLRHDWDHPAFVEGPEPSYPDNEENGCSGC